MIDGIPNRPLYFYQKDIIGSREKQISWIGENVEFQPKVSATFLWGAVQQAQSQPPRCHSGSVGGWNCWSWKGLEFLKNWVKNQVKVGYVWLAKYMVFPNSTDLWRIFCNIWSISNPVWQYLGFPFIVNAAGGSISPVSLRFTCVP